jgi:hypothetical protein
MLGDNRQMHHVAAKAGFKVDPIAGGSEFRAEMVL